MHSKKSFFVFSIIISLSLFCVCQIVFSLENIHESAIHPGNYPSGTGNGENGSIRNMLSDRDLSDKKIYLSGGHKNGDGIVNQFLANMTMSLVDDAMDQNATESTDCYIADDSLLEEINQYRMFNGEIREVNYIKRKMATDAVLNTSLEYFEATPLYQKLKSLEASLSKYFLIEYSKEVPGYKGASYLSHTSSPDKQEKDNWVKISLSTLFYSSADSFDGCYSVEFRLAYLGTSTSTLYDFGKNELKFSLKNENLNAYLSSNWDFTIIHGNEAPTKYLLKMLFKF